ncbi:hypothetical protein J4475_03930 [Candidatus Woesearchaeota archaeon]|nr:hypothetical protein [Candidatus Woesearchaeota archaeon]
MGKRVNILLKDQTHTEAKVLAVLKDITLNEFIEQAVKAAIEHNKEILERFKKK